MKPVIKREDGTVVDAKDMAVGDVVTRTIRHHGRRGRRAKVAREDRQGRQRGASNEVVPEEPEQEINLGTFRVSKMRRRTRREVHEGRTLTPEQLGERLDKWRERHPERSEQFNERQAAFLRAHRKPNP